MLKSPRKILACGPALVVAKSMNCSVNVMLSPGWWYIRWMLQGREPSLHIVSDRSSYEVGFGDFSGMIEMDDRKMQAIPPPCLPSLSSLIMS